MCNFPSNNDLNIKNTDITFWYQEGREMWDEGLGERGKRLWIRAQGQGV